MLRLLLSALAKVVQLDHGSTYTKTKDTKREKMSFPGWFSAEGYAEKLPNLYMGYDFISAHMSASSGIVTCKFANGEEVDCDILIGADGFHSCVRETFWNRRHPPQLAGSCVIQGVVSPSNPSPNLITDEGNRQIEPLAPEEVKKLFPDSSNRSFIGTTVNASVSSVGNGMLGWTIIARQSKPRFYVEPIIAKRQVNVADIDTPLAKDNAASFEPSPLVFSIGDNVVPVSNRAIQAMPNHEELAPPEILNLSLQLLGVEEHFPSLFSRLVVGSDPASLLIKDNVDMSEEPPTDYILRNFHPGRVFLLGDAAHSVAVGIQGSSGASLAISDAIVLAKLLGYAFSLNGVKTIQPLDAERGQDNPLLSFVAEEYSTLRKAVCEQHMHDARAEVNWRRSEPGFVKSMYYFGANYSWTTRTFGDMQTVGGAAMPDQGINWPKLH